MSSKTKLNFFTNKRDEPEEQIFVFFADEKNVSIKTMRKYVSSRLDSSHAFLTARDQIPWDPRWKENPEGDNYLQWKDDTLGQEGLILPSSMFMDLQAEAHCPQVISAMSATYTLEDFEEANLLVNITHHTLVPQHEVLNLDEKKLLLEK